VRNLADVLNRIVSREGRGEVILDMTFVHIDLGTGNAIVVNAGRTAPTLVKSGRTIRDIGGGGNPLGYAGDSELQITPFSLGPGDVVVLCGAGMVETISPDGSILRTSELKRRILARQTPRDVLSEVATLSRVVWRGTHDLFPILVFGWKPTPML
jgi:serine phosphatase RsbU (regulator of sigma subunit)